MCSEECAAEPPLNSNSGSSRVRRFGCLFEPAGAVVEQNRTRVAAATSDAGRGTGNSE